MGRFSENTPNNKRCIYHSPNIPETTVTNFGVSLKLEYPALPFAFFCGSKKRPSDLHVAVQWSGQWLHTVQLITMNIKIGSLTHPPVLLKPSHQNKIDTVVKLNSGYELRPVDFSVQIILQSVDNVIEDYMVTDTQCVLMTAPSTQRRKALSNLAWAQLNPFLDCYSPSKKDTQKEYVCDVSLLAEVLQGRWEEIHGCKHPFPTEFLVLLQSLKSGSFFSSNLQCTRLEGDFLQSKLKEKEFKKIWNWYESVYSFIEEYPALFFNLHIPKILSRADCEAALQQNPTARRTFTVRFASEVEVLGLSVYKSPDHCIHTALAFKKVGDLAEFIQILEEHKFEFMDYVGLAGQNLSSKLVSLSVFAKEKRKKLPTYQGAVSSLTKAISSNDVSSLPSNKNEWTPTDVAEWFRRKGVLRYDLFRKYEITGAQLNLEYLYAGRLNVIGFPPCDCNVIIKELSNMPREPSPVPAVPVVSSPYQPLTGVKRERSPSSWNTNDTNEDATWSYESLYHLLLSPSNAVETDVQQPPPPPHQQMAVPQVLQVPQVPQLQQAAPNTNVAFGGEELFTITPKSSDIDFSTL